MKCRWYDTFENACANGSRPYRRCPTSEHPEVCEFAKIKYEVSELVKILRCGAGDNYKCADCAANLKNKCDRKEANRQAANMLEKLAAEKDAKKPEWISVEDEDELPKNEQEVLIYCNRGGFKFVCPAIYEDGTMLTQNSRWNWNDIEEYSTYSEENDDYFVPKGWWENRQFTPDDVYNCPVDCEVTHWRPLPKPPKEEKQ